MAYTRRKAKIYGTYPGRGQYAYGPLGVRIFAALGSPEFDQEVAKQNAQARAIIPNSLGGLLAAFCVSPTLANCEMRNQYASVFRWLEPRRDVLFDNLTISYLIRLIEQARAARGQQFANSFVVCISAVLMWGLSEGRSLQISRREISTLPRHLRRLRRRFGNG